MNKEVLDHLGIKPGDDVEVDLLPSKGAGLRSGRSSIKDFFRAGSNPHGIHATLEENQEVMEAGWADIFDAISLLVADERVITDRAAVEAAP